MNVISRNRFRNHARQGSLVIDAVVALALLTTAFVALGRLANSSAALSLNSDQRLAATLAGENVVERLRSVAFDALDDKAAEAGRAVEETTGFDVQIKITPFQLETREAIHLSVRVQVSEEVSVNIHDWRIANAASVASEDADE